MESEAIRVLRVLRVPYLRVQKLGLVRKKLSALDYISK